MADTPRGPRPTRSRPVVGLLYLGWTVVLALAVAAAVIPRVSLEDGWSRERVTITKLPYADCTSDEHCTMKPTVRLPDGRSETVDLVIRHPDELLPSAHFRKDGTMLLWISDDADREPRSLRPITATGRLASIAAINAAVLVAIGMCAVWWRAPRRHDERNAGHLADHGAVWVAPVLVAVVAVVLVVLHQGWRTPRHEPIKPPVAPGSTLGD